MKENNNKVKNIKNKEQVTNEKINIDKKIIIFGVFFIAFIILGILIKKNITSNFDLSIATAIDKIRTEKLTSIMILITNLSSAYALTVISILILAICKNKRNAIYIIINLIIVFLFSQAAKFIFQRERPATIFLVEASGYSYPSGHSMVSMAFYTYIAYLLCQKHKQKIAKVLICTITALLILAIGFSRIYLGVHHITDVIGGFILATAYLMLFFKYIYKKKEMKS